MRSDRRQLCQEVVSSDFYDEIRFFPTTKYFPGPIGGHCVMPNIKILRKFAKSDLLEAIETSNQMKVERDSRSREGLKPQEAAI